MEAVEALMGDYYGATLPSTIHKQLGLTPVLVNGGGQFGWIDNLKFTDLRTENVLVDKKSGDLRALIDWQVGDSCVHFFTYLFVFIGLVRKFLTFMFLKNSADRLRLF